MRKTGGKIMFSMTKEIFNRKLYSNKIWQDKDFRGSSSEKRISKKYLLMVCGVEDSLQLTT
jgi:hypothetical protein